MAVLDREEYVEQSYLFRSLSGRVKQGQPVQELLRYVKEEILATSKLPMAIDFMLAELSHVGTMASAMKKLSHYFTPFQTFVMESAESESGRFDMNTALLILEHEARFRSEDAKPVAMFFFQFESICRNRLSYDLGLAAMSADCIYDDSWREWILKVRHKIGIVELADLVYVHSEYYVKRQIQSRDVEVEKPDPLLFGEKEGRIALANRTKEPLYFFAALQRQMNYPKVPKPERNFIESQLPKLIRTVERLEVRIKLLEDEQREKGIDLSKFYEPPQSGDR